MEYQENMSNAHIVGLYMENIKEKCVYLVKLAQNAAIAKIKNS